MRKSRSSPDEGRKGRSASGFVLCDADARGTTRAQALAFEP